MKLMLMQEFVFTSWLYVYIIYFLFVNDWLVTILYKLATSWIIMYFRRKSKKIVKKITGRLVSAG